MQSLEIARRLGAIGQKKDAVKAYMLSLEENTDPAARLEAAAYILQNGGDYRITYTVWQDLYNRGFYRDEILPLMERVFYEPNIRLLKSRYERNCERLLEYPYLFRKDFIPFDELPIRFYPYNDHSGYVPFYVDEAKFGDFVNLKDQRVTRNFFKDLENPILAKDVFSQYELEYLNDNVRKSEWVARENHIYLHYSDWAVFCSWLCVLNMRPLLGDRKIVFLIGDEIARYPIDFREQFGIDYSQYTLKPVGIREVNRIIWHTQLSSHNGGDFFNEVLDSHPNLLMMTSIMFSNMEETVKTMRENLAKCGSLRDAIVGFNGWGTPQLITELYNLRDRTDKDIMVAVYMGEKEWNKSLDPAARIAPAVFFQPHFHNIVYQLRASQNGNTVLEAENVEMLHRSQFIRGFKYIKTFTPMRRFTTSHGATVKFMYDSARESWEKIEDQNGRELRDGEEREKYGVVSDAISERVFNRSFMVDPEDRLYHDSILVRFEDGKLNPKATFTALASFLDIPYTESMTYCSECGNRNYGGKVDAFYGKRIAGFDPEPVYRTYDDYVNDSERYFIEYFLRDAYEYYGYDFKWYDGADIDDERLQELVGSFTTLDRYIRDTYRVVIQSGEIRATMKGADLPDGVEEQVCGAVGDQVREALLEKHMIKCHVNRIKNARILNEGLRFVNKNGQPLYMMPMLHPDPELLEQPLYH